MSFRKRLTAAMLEDAVKRAYCSPDIEARITAVGGEIPTEIALFLARKREAYDAQEARVDEISKAFAEVPTEAESDKLPLVLGVLHEALRGDDAVAYELAAQLSEEDADAVLYVLFKAWDWDLERMEGFGIELAHEQSSSAMKNLLVYTLLGASIDDDEGKRVDRIEYLLGRPLEAHEIDDYLLRECSALYINGTISGEAEDDIQSPIVDIVPWMKACLRQGTDNPALVRLIARTLIGWDDEVDEPFDSLIAHIRD